MKITKAKKTGTTLVEIIVALAILAIIGVTVMEAFTTSSKANRGAKVVDNATVAASNIIQDFKKNPEDFIKKKKLSPSNVENVSKDNNISTFNGEKNYSYVWKETDSKVDNGFTMQYKISEDKEIGSSAMYNPNSTIADDNFCLEKNITDYLIYIVDTPTYGDWNTKGDYLVILFKGWSKKSYSTWINGGDNDTKKPNISYKAWMGWYGADHGRTDYTTYRNMPSRYYNYYAMTDLVFSKCGNDSPAIRRLFGHTSREYPFHYLKKEQCDNGAVSIKIKDGDMDLSKDYNIQIINESTLDVNLYVTASDESKVTAMNDKVKMDLVSGIATRTIVNEKNTYESHYGMDVNIVRNSDKKVIYSISSKEYIAK